MREVKHSLLVSRHWKSLCNNNDGSHYVFHRWIIGVEINPCHRTLSINTMSHNVSYWQRCWGGDRWYGIVALSFRFDEAFLDGIGIRTDLRTDGAIANVNTAAASNSLCQMPFDMAVRFYFQGSTSSSASMHFESSRFSSASLPSDGISLSMLDSDPELSAQGELVPCEITHGTAFSATLVGSWINLSCMIVPGPVATLQYRPPQHVSGNSHFIIKVCHFAHLLWSLSLRNHPFLQLRVHVRQVLTDIFVKIWQQS